MRTLKALLVGAAFMVVSAVGASAAQADAYSYHPSDPSYARMTGTGYLQACDLDVDGHRARAQYTPRYAPGSVYYTDWAPSQGCTPLARFFNGAGYYQFRICVEAEGCDAWRDSIY
jgi:hypothetical protein